MVNFVSQLFIVKGWSFDAAIEHAHYLHAVINDGIISGKIEVVKEELTIFIYQVKYAGDLADSTHAFLVSPNLSVDLYNISG